MVVFFIKFFISSLFSSVILSQPIPKNIFLHHFEKINKDSGLGWKSLSTIRSLRYESKNDTILSSSLVRLSYDSYSNRTGFNFLLNSHFKNFFYIFLDLNVNPSSLFRTSSELISKSKIIKSSGFGFQNEWVSMQIGTGAENWGAGNDIDLAISENSSNYDYLMLSSNYGNIRVNYIHGILERLDGNINRYINARGLEWTNNESIILGLSETIIYSGLNRSFEFAYLNPIASHIEIELNKRLTDSNTGSANAVWQLHFDCFLANRHRFSFNYLIDEFVLDPDIEVGKENGIGYSLRYNYSFRLTSKTLTNLYFSKVDVGTSTFRHEDGYNNFVLNNTPLGWKYGSDGEEIKVGINTVYSDKLIMLFALGRVNTGSESTMFRSYERNKNYLKEINSDYIFFTENFVELNFYWKINAKANIFLMSKNAHKINSNGLFDFRSGAILYFK